MYRLTCQPRPKTDPRPILPAVLIAGATLCNACMGAGDDPPQPADAEGDSADAEWALVEDLRLDANAEDFSAIGWVYVGPEGQIVVQEPQDHRVRIYDSTGTLVTIIGRKGEGPGEFQSVGPVFWVADTMVVWDVELIRGTYLLADGTLVRTEAGRFFGRDSRALGADSTMIFFVPLAVDAQGAKIGEARLMIATGGRSDWGANAFVQVSRDGEPTVVATPPDDEHRMVVVGGLGNPVPFTLRARVEFAGDGSRFLFMTADQSTLEPTYNLTLVRPADDTVFSRSYAYPGEPIPDSAIERGLADMVPENHLARRFRALARERVPVVYPPTDVTLGLDGTIWVELRRTDSGTPVHVLNEAGDPIGSLLLPVRSKIRQASRTHLWATEWDQLGLTSVVRYRVLVLS